MGTLRLTEAVSLVVILLFINIFGYDIFNTSRLVTLILAASIILLIIFSNFKLRIFLANRNLMICSLVFLLSVICSLFFSGISVSEGLIGVYGRNIGALTYLAFVVFMLGAYLSSTVSYINLILKILVGVGFLTSSYGFLQLFGLDPLLTTNLYNPVRGFFGNPNFQSAFLGIASISVVALALSNFYILKIRFIFLTLLLQFQYIIYCTDSVQGFMVTFLGTYIVVIFKILSIPQFKILGKIMIVTIPILILGVILDLLQKSPWVSFLYQPSVAYRGDFWRAGIQMFLNNPLFGVGPDGYRDQFRLYRDEVSVSRIDSVPPINSAHNVFIEIAASGGIFLLLSYVSIILIVLVKVSKLLKASNSYSSATAGAVGCFVGYLTQSFISVNTIPLGVIGWIMFGLLVGLDENGLERYRRFKPRFRLLSILLFPASLLIFIAVPMLRNDVNFKKALESQNVERIISAAYGFPKDVYRMALVAEIFRRAGMEDIGLKIARDSVNLSPKNFEAWEELYQMPNLLTQEKLEILKIMKSLDPLNNSVGK